MLIGLAVGTFIGFFNGICITRLKMESLIETLSMMIILQGALLARTQGKTLTNLSDGYVWIEEATIGGWPIMPVMVALAARQGFAGQLADGQHLEPGGQLSALRDCSADHRWRQRLWRAGRCAFANGHSGRSGDHQCAVIPCRHDRWHDGLYPRGYRRLPACPISPDRE
ncbi:MAG: hypothetical protein U1E55_05085 [Paracoccus sp. (in: a-proteobacteria)]